MIRAVVVTTLKWLGVPLVTAVVGASVTFALLRGISVEALASVLVAVGTFVLAYFTWQSVSRTGDVIAGEDRRHQQSFAPLLTIQGEAAQRPVRGGAETGIRVYNMGYGFALNVEVTLEGTFYYSRTQQIEETDENKRLYAGCFEPERRSVGVDGRNYLNVTQRESEPFDRQIFISALEAEGSYFKHEQEFFDNVYGAPVVHYKVAVAKYEDMFGNVYRTKYLDEELSAYDWIQPTHLRLPPIDSR